MSWFSKIRNAVRTTDLREVHHLIKLREKSPKIFKVFFSTIIRLYGLDMSPKVKVGKGVVFAHNCVGSVIHGNTILEDGVIIFQNVTLGRKDISAFVGEHPHVAFLIKKNAILCVGAIILCPDNQTLVVGEHSVVGANSLLTHSIGDNEMWVGNPARLVKRWNGQEWVKT